MAFQAFTTCVGGSSSGGKPTASGTTELSRAAPRDTHLANVLLGAHAYLEARAFVTRARGDDIAAPGTFELPSGGEFLNPKVQRVGHVDVATRRVRLDSVRNGALADGRTRRAKLSQPRLSRKPPPEPPSRPGRP
jgi:hypothetical protein